MGRRREKMKTCEYLRYLQSKRIRYFPPLAQTFPERLPSREAGAGLPSDRFSKRLKRWKPSERSLRSHTR